MTLVIHFLKLSLCIYYMEGHSDEVVEASIKECINVFSDDAKLDDTIIQASQIYEGYQRG